MTRVRFLFLLIVALMVIPGWALAGGWAVATFDEVPAEFEAGVSYDLSYTILQHGKTAVDVGPSSVQITDSDGDVTTFAATRLSDPGRYQVSVTFPDSGSWTWEVSQGGFAAHELGVVSVAAATSTATGATGALLPVALAIAVGLVAVQVVHLAKQRRPAVAE